MATSLMDDLDKFYFSLKKGMSVGQFLENYRIIFVFIKSNNLMENYRLGKDPLKKLRDEVTPVARFVYCHATPQDHIQFSLDDSFPDCTLFLVSGRRLEIEVTVGQAKERLYTMRELNDFGEGRGFLNLTDDRPEADFRNAIEQERCAYSIEDVQKTITGAIAICAKNKEHIRADILLIEMSLLACRKELWLEIQSCFAELTYNLLFSEVFLVGYGETGNFCLKLK